MLFTGRSWFFYLLHWPLFNVFFLSPNNIFSTFSNLFQHWNYKKHLKGSYIRLFPMEYFGTGSWKGFCNCMIGLEGRDVQRGITHWVFYLVVEQAPGASVTNWAVLLPWVMFIWGVKYVVYVLFIDKFLCVKFVFWTK